MNQQATSPQEFEAQQSLLLEHKLKKELEQINRFAEGLKSKQKTILDRLSKKYSNDVKLVTNEDFDADFEYQTLIKDVEAHNGRFDKWKKACDELNIKRPQSAWLNEITYTLDNPERSLPLSTLLNYFTESTTQVFQELMNIQKEKGI